MNQTLLNLIKLMHDKIGFKGLYTATSSYDTFTKKTMTVHRIEQCNNASDVKNMSVVEDIDVDKIIKHLQNHLADQLTKQHYDNVFNVECSGDYDA